MASDDHSTVSLSTSKRRSVFFVAIDVSRGCALSALIMDTIKYKTLKNFNICIHRCIDHKMYLSSYANLHNMFDVIKNIW